MAFAILILMVFFCAVAVRQQMIKNKVQEGSQDKVIKALLVRYKTLREHHGELKANAFVIGKAQENHKGSLRDHPKALAVRILDDKGAQRDAAAELGMEVIEIKGKVFYQFPVEVENELSEVELGAVLAKTKEMIEAKYPDDFVGRTPTYMTVVIDGKKALKKLNG